MGTADGNSVGIDVGAEVGALVGTCVGREVAATAAGANAAIATRTAIAACAAGRKERSVRREPNTAGNRTKNDESTVKQRDVARAHARLISHAPH